MRSNFFPFTFVLILFLTASGLAGTITVGTGGDYSEIQPAIDAASDGDEVIVLPGTYLENINFSGKNIILRSTDPEDPSVVEATIIDGNSAGSVVTFAGTENETCVLSGLTIQNGRGTNMDLGGILNAVGGGIIGNGNTAKIENCIIKENTCWGGAGLYDCDGLIKGNVVQSNIATHMGGGLSECDGHVCRNVISENTAAAGGGIGSCNAIISNNIITSNQALDTGQALTSSGGGLYGCYSMIINNVIYGNHADDYGGGMYRCYGTLSNCIVWNNTANDKFPQITDVWPIYSCVQDFEEGPGNISDDPQFVDPENGDFHLQSISPCIDTGYIYYLPNDYAADIDGECRLSGVSIDMGVDEVNSLPDEDGDLLSDIDESAYTSDFDIMDSDNDGLIDGIEVLRGTSPITFNAPPGINIPDDFETIQEGIFHAFPSENVIVESGTYYENISFAGKDISLIGEDVIDNASRHTSVIDANNYGFGVSFSGKETEQCRLMGFSIKHGVFGIYGGATKGTIKYNCILENNSAGIYYCEGSVLNNLITGNTGPGIEYCSGLISENNVVSNISGKYSDACGLSRCSGTITGNFISENEN